MEEPFPQKPSDERGFEKPVAWLLARELIASLKWTVLYALFKGKLDARDWMQAAEIAVESQPDAGAYWFDYLADTGDGQKATYSIAYLCMSDLWVEPSPQVSAIVSLDERSDRPMRLPRGEFLFIGGDTSYHIADYATLANRFQNPFRWAFDDLKRAGKIRDGARHPLFGIPGNHDYYDALDGFNRQFRRPATDEDAPNSAEQLPLLAIPGFKRCQEASFVALKLPFGWWLWGMDIEDGEIDFRQCEFFRTLHAQHAPRKLIIATPEPTTVLGKYADADANISQTFAAIGLERPFLRAGEKLHEGKCRLDLSGNVHHYARYWGPASDTSGVSAPTANNYASVVAGLGGAFLHPSHTDVNEIEEQALYPSKEASRREIAKEIFNPWNIWAGGYVWLLGCIIAAVVAFAATIPSSSQEAIHKVLSWRGFGLSERQLAPMRLSVLQALPVYALDRPADGQGSRQLGGVLLAVSLAALVGGAIYSKRLLIGLDKQKRGKRGTITGYARALVGVILLLAVGSMAGWMWAFGRQRAEITPFGSSLLVLASLVWSVFALVESVFYAEYLIKQTYDRTIKWWDYWPIWALLGCAVMSTVSGVWLFGTYPAAYVFSDLVFTLVFFGVGLSLILLAVFVGGALQGTVGRLGFGLLGVWHALLQLIVPFLLVFLGSWWVLILALAIVFAFRRVGMFLVTRNIRTLLVVAWLVYGAILIGLPTYGPRLNLPIDLSGPLLPLSSLTWVIASCLLAGLVGTFMTCVWLGWYFAVALAYNGHTDQAGGAARIERFKQFIRFRLTENDLTGYVIAVDDPEIDGRELKPKIIDVFQLRV
jgi:hypothetical protein